MKFVFQRDPNIDPYIINKIEDHILKAKADNKIVKEIYLDPDEWASLLYVGSRMRLWTIPKVNERYELRFNGIPVYKM